MVAVRLEFCFLFNKQTHLELHSLLNGQTHQGRKDHCKP
jgi:hypothetical protein